MSRRSLLVTLSTVLLTVVGLAGLLCFLVRYERSWYVNAAVPEGAFRKERSQEFCTDFLQFVSTVSTEQEWFGKFTQEQINSYFDEDFINSGLDRRVLPEAISEPRLCIEPELLRFGFRYGSGFWSTVITVDLRTWLPAGEPNVMALELVGLHAGIIPIKMLSLLERIAQAARDNGIEVIWYRHRGHPVALMRFQADQPRVTMKLDGVNLGEGSMMIRGCFTDGTPARASVHPTDPTAAALKPGDN